MNKPNNDEILQAVRKRYGAVASQRQSCGCGSSCCNPSTPNIERISQALGYSTEDLHNIPDGANMGLGCGNPQAIANLKIGEIVLDLGSGGGFDCFLASRRVGETGHVIGVDMTPEMISKARENAHKAGFKNVEFRLGEIENLPVADETANVVISNCVINLSPDKPRVFKEAFRVLKNGGRLAVSDVVALVELSDKTREDLALYTGCIAGASTLKEIEKYLWDAGFKKIRITPKEESREIIKNWTPDASTADLVKAACIEAVKL